MYIFIAYFFFSYFNIMNSSALNVYHTMVTDFVIKLSLFLGRLFDRVDLIKPVSNVRPSVRTSVRPSTKSFFDFNEIWRVRRGRRLMQCDPIQGQSQGHKPLKVANPAIFKSSSAVYNGSWQLTTDS